MLVILMTFDFEEKVYNRLVEDKEIKRILKLKVKSIISFPLVYRRLGVLYHFSKKESNEILDSLKERGLIEIVKFHGIRIIKVSIKF